MDLLRSFKNLLGITTQLDAEDESVLQKDLEEYKAIIKTNDYDTYAYPEPITVIKPPVKEKTPSAPDTKVKPLDRTEKPPCDTEKEVQVSNSTEAQPATTEPAPSGSDLYVHGRRKEFKSLLDYHMKLLSSLSAENYLPGQPTKQAPKFTQAKLPFYDIPEYVYDALETLKLGNLDLSAPLTPKNYALRFQRLLWLEEAHQAIMMRRYDMYDVMIGVFDHNYFVVPVPGLAEGRPSLMRGDKMLLRSSKRSSYYEGYIHEVRVYDVLIKLHESLHSKSMAGLKFDITFLFSRTSYRRCHHAVHMFKTLGRIERFLFPKAATGELPKPKVRVAEQTPEELRCFMACLNKPQRAAVLNVLRGQSRPAPYIVFGPPGTGKTVTLVECILQVYSRNQRFKLLVCGNSNAAANILAIRIKDSGLVPLNKMIRLMAFNQIERNLVPPEIDDISVDLDMVSSEMLDECRIVVTTCCQAGTLSDFNYKFDYVFIDEAGHASEPESLVPMTLLNGDGCVVLAGDPHQLGPVSMSFVASDSGFSLSMLERLYKLPIYQRQQIEDKSVYDSRYLSKLVISYRCDPRVMVVNNKMFYEDELSFTQKTPKKWLHLMNTKNPLIFHHVNGRDMREYQNPSWFNPNEAIQVLSYVRRLYGAGLKPEQLGIITPYRRQIEKLNVLFDSCQMKRCKITTMEEFQGDEKEVIIISTVRAREKNIKHDQRFKLGFLFSPKRFNVAISRAKWLVIVIGDQNILERDDCWLKYIEQAHKVVASSKEPALDTSPVSS